MTPERILTLLDIVEKSAKTPSFSHITGAAHAALMAVQLYAIDKPNGDEEEKSTNPTPRASRRT